MQTELRELNALREEFRNQRAHLDYQSDEEGDDFDDWWHITELVNTLIY